ncbi:hypothetical protein [Hymenobacter metallilatus]|uniref:hypothetical protein n=1 Tax=Hymenobacter metallilatus TaxID=2493666 RepID=UPI00163A3229|nr:hypothetical protein [Hymenobacter metallilatus]
MYDAEKDRKFVLVVMQCLGGLAGAFVGALSFTYISYWSNNGTSLFADIFWAMAGD